MKWTIKVTKQNTKQMQIISNETKLFKTEVLEFLLQFLKSGVY